MRARVFSGTAIFWIAVFFTPFAHAEDWAGRGERLAKEWLAPVEAISDSGLRAAAADEVLAKLSAEVLDNATALRENAKAYAFGLVMQRLLSDPNLEINYRAMRVVFVHVHQTYSSKPSALKSAWMRPDAPAGLRRALNLIAPFVVKQVETPAEYPRWINEFYFRNIGRSTAIGLLEATQGYRVGGNAQSYLIGEGNHRDDFQKDTTQVLADLLALREVMEGVQRPLSQDELTRLGRIVATAERLLHPPAIPAYTNFYGGFDNEAEIARAGTYARQSLNIGVTVTELLLSMGKRFSTEAYGDRETRVNHSATLLTELSRNHAALYGRLVAVTAQSQIVQGSVEPNRPGRRNVPILETALRAATESPKFLEDLEREIGKGFGALAGNPAARDYLDEWKMLSRLYGQKDERAAREFLHGHLRGNVPHLARQALRLLLGGQPGGSWPELTRTLEQPAPSELSVDVLFHADRVAREMPEGATLEPAQRRRLGNLRQSLLRRPLAQFLDSRDEAVVAAALPRLFAKPISEEALAGWIHVINQFDATRSAPLIARLEKEIIFSGELDGPQLRRLLNGTAFDAKAKEPVDDRSRLPEEVRVAAATQLLRRHRLQDGTRDLLRAAYLRGRLPEGWRLRHPEALRDYHVTRLGSVDATEREEAWRAMPEILRPRNARGAYDVDEGFHRLEAILPQLTSTGDIAWKRPTIEALRELWRNERPFREVWLRRLELAIDSREPAERGGVALVALIAAIAVGDGEAEALVKTARQLRIDGYAGALCAYRKM